LGGRFVNKGGSSDAPGANFWLQRIFLKIMSVRTDKGVVGLRQCGQGEWINFCDFVQMVL